MKLINSGFNACGRREFTGWFRRVTGRSQASIDKKGSTSNVFFDALASHAEWADFYTGKNLAIIAPQSITITGRDEYFVLLPRHIEFTAREG